MLDFGYWMLDIRLMVDLWRAGINPAPTINLSRLRLIWWSRPLCLLFGRQGRLPYWMLDAG